MNADSQQEMNSSSKFNCIIRDAIMRAAVRETDLRDKLKNFNIRDALPARRFSSLGLIVAFIVPGKIKV